MDPQAAFDLSGEALNRAVAVHVMGLREGADFGTWPEHQGDDWQDCVRCNAEWPEVSEGVCVRRPPRYSESSRLGIWSSRHFGQVIDRMHALGWDVELRLPRPGYGQQCLVERWIPDPDQGGEVYRQKVLMGGETIAEAVCRAALRAVLEYPDPTQNTEK